MVMQGGVDFQLGYSYTQPAIEYRHAVAVRREKKERGMWQVCYMCYTIFLWHLDNNPLVTRV